MTETTIEHWPCLSKANAMPAARNDISRIVLFNMENLVLYRKYRPQTFGEIMGQAHVVKTLQNSLAQNKIAHAYLLAGPRGSGKTTIARILSKSANCAARGNLSEPCNKCPSCADFNAGRSLDLIEIDAASNRGIDEIKNLRENVRFGPSSGRYKVYLIDEAHMLTKEAFNAFLKTLEEPPPHAIFILATTEAHRLPATIISRTQRFDFKRLSAAELEHRLKIVSEKENIQIEPEALRLIAHEADGSARDAEGMLGQVIAIGENKITLDQTEEVLGLFSNRKIKEFVGFLAAQDSVGALIWLHKTVEHGYDVNQFLKSLNHYLRKMMLMSLSPDLALKIKNELAEEDYKIMANQVKILPTPFVVALISGFSEAKKKLDYYPLPQMAVEVALINLLSDRSIPTIDSNLVEDSTIKISNSQFPISKQTSISNEQISKTNPDVLGLIQSKWAEIIKEVQPHNHSLSGFLLGMKPQEATASSLTLTTKYSFHRDRLSDLKNKKIIEDAVHKVAGHRLVLNCVLEK
ncbi:MAG: DNA polymerase III subunit gamma/tau [Candidatus Sungbacteria bacterium]|uniref:DNA polymerase III subunit gamma/tau n=2 Tax=Candidatus Sungiibacteriota bacterium TaxID=2750080 RepID=A0A931YDV5_9BACT|nr:DNA polymerase III subunit gamma/tau [Candidatus Sungbacteria bacterium]